MSRETFQPFIVKSFTAVLDFEVQRCTRRCAATDRELRPGEVVYSTLIPSGKDFIRRDYAADAWRGAPENALGWWKCTIPDGNAKIVHWAPNDVMLHYFNELEGDQQAQDIRYVLTLLMIRRRVLRLEQTQVDDQGQELLVVYCPRNETEYRVQVVMPSAERIAQIQQHLADLLFANVA